MSTGPPVVVLPPAADGGRQVTVRGERVGTAYDLFDVLDLVHRAGLPAEDQAVDDPELIEWRGGGPYDFDRGTEDGAAGRGGAAGR
ncbi:hypothetical protein ABZX30_21180 [Streptomyces sp. NPDC004542]|uniref:hypothetical protein n=1 Tax=Streptomyces sp. NPDC004542 TaxID=3154281 RepID=UPI0033A4397F